MLQHRVSPHTARRPSALPMAGRRYEVFTARQLDQLPQLQKLGRHQRAAMKAVAAVLPFRVNNYVVEELIDWSDLPRDPIFQLTFPQPGMLASRDFDRMYDLVRSAAPADEIRTEARRIQHRMNPHPAGQMELNVPDNGGAGLEGVQHKYRETVLFFPAAGQTCHAYCTYCFRWAQFVGLGELKFAARQTEELVDYLQRHREVTSVLITGGDPMIMRTAALRRYVEPLLEADGLDHVDSIRFGTKAPAYWPYRFVTDRDSDDLLRLFEQIRRKGKHVALMAHYSHPRELETPIAERAIRRILATGAVVRCQAPLIRHVNDSAGDWARMWRRQVQLSTVPYYMFVERDTGANDYFEVPLARALTIFDEAYRTVSGLARTVRGPSMSSTPGKVLVDGVTTIGDERVFVLKFLQARDPAWVGQPFFAQYDENACWLDDLKPALGEREFFFEAGLREMQRVAVG